MTSSCFGAGVPAKPQPLGAACAFDGSGRIGSVVNTGKRLYGVDNSAAPRVLFEFGAGWPFEVGSAVSEFAITRGDYIAAGLGGTPKGEQNPKRAVVELVVLDPSFNVVFHEVREIDYQNFLDVGARGNESGVFAFSVESYDRHEMIVTGPAGERRSFPGYVPYSDPDAAGRLAVSRREPGTTTQEWLDSCTGRIEPLRLGTVPGYSSLASRGAVLHYVGPTTSQAFMETFGGVESIPVSLAPEVRQILVHSSGWVLLDSDKDTESLALASVPRRESRVVRPLVPAGLRAFDGSREFNPSVASVDSSGRLLYPLRDDFIGRLYASSDGQQWIPLGLPMGEVHSLKVLEHAGTYLVGGSSLGLLTSDWPPPSPGVDRFDYQQLQLVRPESGVQLLLYQASAGTGYTRRYRVSEDGGCAGTLNGDKLEITSAITGIAATITLPVASGYYGDFGFTQGEGRLVPAP